jgi:hypothetical protein
VALGKYTQTYVPVSIGGFIARLLYFLIVPATLVVMSQVLPIMGALVNVAIALLVFVLGEVARGWAATSKLAAKLLKKPLAFEAHYRQNPPRNFAYYVFYPLLFPYWLLNKQARAEFLLFKGYTILSLVLLIVGSIWQYFTKWLPELSFAKFLPTLFATLVLEAFIVLAFLMPITTTIVHFHMTFRRKRLIALLTVGFVSIVFAIARLHAKRASTVSFSTRTRVQLRSEAEPASAKFARRQAIRAAWKIISRTTADVEGDGIVEGEALDAAHEALQPFYKDDEAFAFQLWAEPRRHPQKLVLYLPTNIQKKTLVWTAVGRKGVELTEPLSRTAVDKMIKAADK